jgi:hypothetical protein
MPAKNVKNSKGVLQYAPTKNVEEDFSLLSLAQQMNLIPPLAGQGLRC